MWQSDWALITGASSGIGREFARQLAAGGMNVALVARRVEVLETLAHEMRSGRGVDTLTLPFDLCAADSIAAIRTKIDERGARIRMLVNCAAAGHWGRMETASVDGYSAMLQLNTGAPVALCLAFLDHLRTFPRSAIVNVSSQAAFQPVPFMAVYAASKAFMHSFSVALYEEWKEHGIHVQTLVPAPTQSEFDERAGAYESGLKDRAQPSEAVEASLRALKKDQPVVASAKGVLRQRLLNAVIPPRKLVHEVAKLFRPPQGS